MFPLFIIVFNPQAENEPHVCFVPYCTLLHPDDVTVLGMW